MLHPTRLPSCTPILECVLDFQERLLAFACARPQVIQAELEAEFGADVAGWLYTYRQQVLDPLKHFAQLPPADKASVLEQFRHDRGYWNFRDDPGFIFQLLHENGSPDHIRQVKQWLNGYYEQLKRTGYHPAICGHARDEFRDKDWWEGYFSENPKRNTCSICDASLNAGGRTIDHYLPKARYPTLTIHPANLLPLCNTCNNEIKGENDPLNGHTLREVYLPYHRHVRAEARLDFNIAHDGKYELRFVPLTDDPEIPVRLGSLEQLFNIPSRWEKTIIDEAAEKALRLVKVYLQARNDIGQPVDIGSLRDSIEKTCTSMERDWGVLQYMYLATEWLRWSSQNQYDSLAAELLA